MYNEKDGEYAEILNNIKICTAQLSRNVNSDGSVKLSYACGSSVSLTHRITCVHITLDAQVFSEFICTPPDLRDWLVLITSLRLTSSVHTGGGG